MVTIDEVKPAYIPVNEITNENQDHAPPATVPHMASQQQPPPRPIHRHCQNAHLA